MATIAARMGLALGLVCAGFATPLAVAQLCEEGWLPQGQLPGTDRGITASVMWDPDGTGPRTPVLVVGGTFANVGGIRANNIAVYDTRTALWSTLGEGVNGSVFALAVAPDNTLLVGGIFTSAGGVQAFDLARWNGTAWSSLNVNMSFGVRAISVLPDNSIAVGGMIGGDPASSVQIFDGVSWRRIGTIFQNILYTGVSALATVRLPSGGWRLLAGGQFFTNNQSFTNIAAFDGTAWSSFGQVPGAVSSLLSVPTATHTQEIYAGLRTGTVVRWDGSAWQPMGGVFRRGANPGWINSLAAVPEPSGSFALYCAGWFSTYNNDQVSGLARWTGEDWAEVGGGIRSLGMELDQPNGLTLCAVPVGSGRGLFVGGAFTTAGDTGVMNAAILSQGHWSPIGVPRTLGANAAVFAIEQVGSDEIVVAGRFTSVAGMTANRIVKRTGSTASPWVPLGSGMNNDVLALLPLNAGELLAGGMFTMAGNTPAGHIARWTGQAWTPLGSGLNGSVGAIVALPTGDIVVGGSFTSAGGIPARGVAKWDGTAWSALGAELQTSVRSLAVVPRVDGVNWDLYAGGSFEFGSGIARWTGTTWSPLDSGVRLLTGQRGTVYALKPFPRATGGHDLIVGGAFQLAGSLPATNIARWNGSAWSSIGGLGSGDVEEFVSELTIVRSLDGAPELVAGGLIYAADGFTPVRGIARFTGTRWTNWPGTLSDEFGGGVYALAAVNNSPDGWRLAVGGTFAGIGGEVSPHFALWGCQSCRADLSRDGTVDFFDYLDFAFAFETQREDADFDRSGSIDFFDYLEFVAAFAEGC